MSGTETDLYAATTALLGALHIHKSFGPVAVLQDVSFDLRPGEVHALLGENGAGKSTLLKIIAGVHTPDSGQISIDQKNVTLPSPHAAQRLGIALIHQEPLGFPDLSVGENIFIGRSLPRTRGGAIDWAVIASESRRILSSLGVALDPKTKLAGLSIADQQMVELAAALAQNARVLLMDEPTAALTPQEVGRLFRIIRQLTQSGVAIAFISHRLEEVFEISDRITVLRDGAFVGTVLPKETTTPQIIQMMVGRPLSVLYEQTDARPGETLLRVENLTRKGKFHNISFTLRRGEIVGLAGLVGAGRTDVAQSIFGAAPLDSGQIWINNQPQSITSPQRAIQNKIAYIPEDRAQHGLLLPFSIASNIGLANFPSVSRLGLASSRKERTIARTWREKLSIRSRDDRQRARELSGGNQQKVVLAKWLQTSPDILLFDEPTRGIDVGAKAEVHHLMNDLARQGKAILMISSDLPEILGVSHRILVMREGQLTAEFPSNEATQEKIMTAATASPLEGSAPAEPRSSLEGWASARPRSGESPTLHSKPRSSRSSTLQNFRELGIAAIVLLIFLFASLLQPRFLAAGNLRSIFLYIPLILIIATTQLMVIISRNIDLSVGSILAFAAIVIGMIFRAHPDFPLPIAALLAITIGAAMGSLNGLLVTLLKVPSIIATLGTLSAYRGLVFIVSNSKQIDNNDIPIRLIALSQTSPIKIPWLILFAAIIAILAHVFLKYFKTGRHIYAIGSNPIAAQLRGIPVQFNLFLIFLLSGASAGFAGLMWASRYPTINPGSAGSSFELQVISAVIIGGANVFGGSGSVLGTILGCLLLAVINTALPVLGVAGSYQQALYGLSILLAASTDTLLFRRTKS